MKRTRTTRSVLAGSVAALALGVTACEVEDGAGGDPGLEDPGLEDGGVEDGGTGDDL